LFHALINVEALAASGDVIRDAIQTPRGRVL